MDVVIDAQILNWFFQESELGKAPPCTSSPVRLFARLGQLDLAFVDAGQQIESEWRSVVDSDWFDAWFGDRLTSGDINIVRVETCSALLRRLETRCGFPRGSRDKWYVRTAASRATQSGDTVALISEDVDLFAPSAKNQASQRQRVLSDCAGPVVSCLRGHNVDVRTVVVHLAA